MSRQPHPLVTLAQLVNTPSAQDGIPKEVEDDLRVVGCMMIQEAGIMLDLPQSTMAIAQVIFHRFFFVSSMCSFGIQDISISSLYLSTKLNETPIRLRDLINTYMFLAARTEHLLSFPADKALPIDSPGPSSMRYSMGMDGKGKGKERAREKVFEGMVWEVPGFHDEVFWDWKDSIVGNEMQILKRLGFNMQVDLPYNHAINYLKILDLVFEPNVAQTTWSILNDLLLSPVYAIHPAYVLACASILLTTRLLRIPLPSEWYLLFDVELDDILGVAGWAMRLWHDWGIGPVVGGKDGEGQAGRREKENRWRRGWVLGQGKRAVRRWVGERERAAREDVGQAAAL
ncbi:cyclin-dependent protein kinase regulator [Dioszegia hungarica]|uniref:Cyclin-dependent protein kinase regulator n=1 Tax=Dioszegia hungarica TaxID=4972 RepID=A0AA38LVI4_9TREE|nr:cyclin-dependent protein kinase regulator [Dioszegia hungarica]KAI9637365.1 cyclin-dependent protein kinase regulator [Dioszegia hungarica]